LTIATPNLDGQNCGKHSPNGVVERKILATLIIKLVRNLIFYGIQVRDMAIKDSKFLI